MTQPLTLDGRSLTVPAIHDVALRERPVRLDPEARERVTRARAVVERCVAEDRVVYGITTGFGKLSNVRIDRERLQTLQANLVRSHACGTGRPLSPAEVRATLCIRANVLARGHSGVRPVVVDLLLDMLNRNVLPVIPEKGSVGASGDLAPSAHLALVLMGEGRALVGGEVVGGGEALRRAGLDPLVLEAKEGLAVLNGTQFMAAVGALQLHELDWLIRAASLAAAMSGDALRGTDRHLDPQIHDARPHPGQAAVAAEIRRLLAGSEIRSAHLDCPNVQDAYSLRCVPQVHGAVRDTLDHARQVLEREVNSATDNPLVFPDTGDIISGGNFHGEPLAFVLDFLAIAATELASIAERRVERLINPDLSGLPAFLVREPGLNSGYMIAQLTVVSLLAECKVLAHPASVDSVPTSANKEDHVSMGMTAANKLRQVVENLRGVLAVELMLAAQALDFHRPLRSSPALEAAHARIRQAVPFLAEDRDLSGDIAAMIDLLAARDLPLGLD